MNNSARVNLWGNQIGAVTWDDSRDVGIFQYTPDFAASGIEIAPLMMPLSGDPYEFPGLPFKAFRGLPGLLADSLPDKFGNSLIDAWQAARGRAPDQFNPVERLCYIGNRGMGALEFEPAIFHPDSRSEKIDVAELLELANEAVNQRKKLIGRLSGEDDRKAIEDILRVGTSAGGARAKAILAWNPKTNEFQSGQFECPDGFEYWILKFDGISNNRDKELADPKGYGKIEYAYSLLATQAGIVMTPCRLHHEGGRSHFMTRRFDREGCEKIHMQSLGAIAHVDYNQPAAYSYEQAIQTMKRMRLPPEDWQQQVLRAMFNVIGRNQDDHVKNIAFLMDKRGAWRLSPAFDVSYAYNPGGDWTGRHQMSLNGKRDEFSCDDLITLAKVAGIKTNRARELLDRVMEAFKQWPQVAAEVGVAPKQIRQIQAAQRLSLIQ
jgi:serine/threonine-protein kinase HipA